MKNDDEMQALAPVDEAMIGDLWDVYRKITGLPSTLMSPRVDRDGIPIPDGICSGYAINNMVQAALARSRR